MENVIDASIYKECKIFNIQSLYLLSSVFWLFLIFILLLFRTNWSGWLILLLPIFVYGFGFYNASFITVEVEKTLFSGTYLTIGLLIILALLTWFSNNISKIPFTVYRKYMMIIVISLFFLVLTIIDVWVRPEWVSYLKHLKSILQTAALTLVLYLLNSFYIEANLYNK